MPTSTASPPAGSPACPYSSRRKHGFNPFRSSRAFARADRAVGSLADEHIAISRGLARYLAAEEGFAEESFTVIHYGIEPGPEPEPYAGDAPRLLCVGRLIPIKGHAVLLQALAQARRVVRDLTLDIAGSGPLEADLRAQAESLGLNGAVRFLGRVSAVPYDESAIVVVPSLGEGFGMVALEAMERGRPVIASDVGGLPEIVADGETGVVVPSADAQALAWAIAELAANLPRAAALGEAGRRRALAEFRQERCTERHEELYRSALVRAGLRRLNPGPRPLEGEGGEQREQEVERSPVANRPGEDHRRQRVVGEQEQRQGQKAPRHEEAAGKREPVERERVERLDDLPARLGEPASRFVVVLDRERRRPEHAHCLCGQSCLLARVLAPEVDHLGAVEAHLGALVHRARSFGRDVRRTLGPGRHPGEIGDVVDPLAARQDRVRRRVVRLPERSGIGRDRSAADRDLVADEPRRNDGEGGNHRRAGHEQGASRRPRLPGDVDRERQGQQHEARVAEDRQSGERSRRGSRARPSAARTRRSASRVSRASRKPSRISRLTWTSCQTTYGCSVASNAAATPIHVERSRLPISSTSSAVATATSVCASPTASHAWPNGQ